MIIICDILQGISDQHLGSQRIGTQLIALGQKQCCPSLTRVPWLELGMVENCNIPDFWKVQKSQKFKFFVFM